MTTPYDVHREWGVRRADGHVVAMLNEDIARGFAGRPNAGFTLVSRVVAHIPWTADADAALAEVDRLRGLVDPNPAECGDCSPWPTSTVPGCTRPAGHFPATAHETAAGTAWNWTLGDHRRAVRW